MSVKLISSKTFHELPVFFESPSGSRRLLVSARPLAYSSSQPDQQTENLYLILFHDNTTQKELEDLRSRRNKLMAMGGLASKMAHEIRNPLNGIGMLAQRLLKEFQPKINEEEYKQMTQSIRQESKRINEIVETFLNYARTPELKFKKTDLKTLLESDSSLLQSICRVPLQMDLDEGCYINADADQIKQALINLVKNACEASPESVPVKIFCRKEADRIRLCVEDSGSGIPAEIQDKVFDLYFTTKSSGMGLGLSIVEKIISAHQGRALVESPYFADGQTQQGARFIIDFPSQN